MLWGHSVQYLSAGAFDFFEDTVFETIYSFHMPLFMFLSGYTFFWSCKRRKLQEILRKRIQSIGIPMLSWGLIEYALTLTTDVPGSLPGILRSLVFKMLEIWFLWAVLVSSFIVAVCYKASRHKIIRYPLMILLGATLLYKLPNRDNNLFTYPFFVLGFAFNELELFKHRWYRSSGFAAFVGWLVMVPFYEKVHYIYISGITSAYSQYGIIEHISIDLFRYAIGLLGTLALIWVVQNINHRIVEMPIAHTIINCGKKTLCIYVMQRIVIEYFIAHGIVRFVDVMGYNPLTRNIFLFDCVITPIFALICGVILMRVSQSIEKSKYINAVLFGK